MAEIRFHSNRNFDFERSTVIRYSFFLNEIYATVDEESPMISLTLTKIK